MDVLEDGLGDGLEVVREDAQADIYMHIKKFKATYKHYSLFMNILLKLRIKFQKTLANNSLVLFTPT